MQKKLIALAVAGLVSGGAFAQSAVTIYGIVDQSIESANYGDGAKTRISGSGYATERLGFRVSEALGNGLSANVNLESGLGSERGMAGGTAGAGQTQTQFFDRLSTIGLSGSWGSVNFGRQYSPSFNVKASSDVFGFAGLATSATMWQGATRVNNSIRYDSPSMSGFTAAILYGTGDSGAGANYTESVGGQDAVGLNKNVGRHVGVNFRYANGPLAVGYGYGSNDSATQTVGTNTVKTKANNLALTYDFGVAKLWAGWNTYKNDASPVVTLDNRVYTLGVTAPVGSGTVRFQYGNLNDKLAANLDASQVSLGYAYPMSKRTTAYATWSRMDNKDNAGAGRGLTLGGGNAIVGNGANAAATTFDPNGFQVGLSHTF